MSLNYPHERILMGPGPSPVPVRILNALAMPTLGHLDPQYVEIMDEVTVLLRQVFQTENRLTFPVSGTGMAGMEALAVNLLEPGDEAIVCVNGVFGARMKDIVTRCGATAHEVAAPWGTSFADATIAEAVQRHPKAKLLTIVHAETSTGALQPLEGISKIVHDAGMLLVVDAVTSLGGHPVKVDAWDIDAIFSGTQKCLSCPPGLSPVSFGPRAVEAIEKRTTKVQSWYLDVSMLKNYYLAGGAGGARAYHHTAPINMTYALREALRIVMEEGLEARFARHQANHLRLRAGLEKMGLTYIPENSLWSLNAIHKPEGADDAACRKRLLSEFGLEIGAGLGPFAGKAWRIGLMGHGSTARNVELCLAALRTVLNG